MTRMTRLENCDLGSTMIGPSWWIGVTAVTLSVQNHTSMKFFSVSEMENIKTNINLNIMEAALKSLYKTYLRC